MTTYDEHRARHLSRIRDQQQHQSRCQVRARPDLIAQWDTYRKKHLLRFALLMVASILTYAAAAALWLNASDSIVPPVIMMVASLVFVALGARAGKAMNAAHDATFDLHGRQVTAWVSIPGAIDYAYEQTLKALEPLAGIVAADALRDDANRLIVLTMDTVQSIGYEAAVLPDVSSEMAEIAASACALADVLAGDSARSVLESVRTGDSRVLAAEAAAAYERDLGRA